MRGAPFSCEGERVMTADERSPKPRFFYLAIRTYPIIDGEIRTKNFGGIFHGKKNYN